MAKEAPGHTLQATILVHESYSRLLGQTNPTWENRRHFFSAAAEAMRRILIEHARKKKSKKRGAGAAHVSIDDVEIQCPLPPEQVLALDEALQNLSELDECCAQLVTLRYFAGLKMTEIADILECSPRKVDSLWKFSKAWLRKEIEGTEGFPNDTSGVAAED